MKKFDLNNFTKGWFIGNFEPTLFTTENFEVGVKRYKAGDKENLHCHIIAREWTCVITGKILMGGEIHEKDAIVEIQPEEYSSF